MDFYKSAEFKAYPKNNNAELKVDLKSQLKQIVQPFVEVWVSNRYVPIIAKRHRFGRDASKVECVAFVSELIDKSVNKAALSLLIGVNVWWGEHGVSFCFEGETILVITKKNLPKENDNEQ